MSGPVFRVAVLSDLHAYSEGRNRPSFLDVRSGAHPSNQHPISSLKTLISKTPIQADFLLCPGDLGHRASIQGIEYAWEQLHDIGRSLGARLVTGTAGNHDMDSRRIHTGFASDRTLKMLDPAFPLPGDLWDRYWARHYAIVDHSDCRLVVLNSSAYHGQTDEEQNHGRVDTFTLEQMKSELLKPCSARLNILLCHHHPQQHSEHNLGEDDVMKNGQLLLDLLGSGGIGQWLLIHGHKHHPKITYASGSSLSPAVLSAGSFSFRLSIDLDGVARNQFYVVEFSSDDLDKFGLVGQVSAWDWMNGSGWVPATSRSGLPASFGFGARDPRGVTDQVEQFMKGKELEQWSTVSAAIRSVDHLLPSDLRLLNNFLVLARLAYSDDGSRDTPFQIARLS